MQYVNGREWQKTFSNELGTCMSTKKIYLSGSNVENHDVKSKIVLLNYPVRSQIKASLAKEQITRSSHI